MRGTGGRLRSVTFCLAGLVWAAGAAAQERCPEPVARIVSIQGAVGIQGEGETGWRPAALDAPLCVGDSVRVGPVSRAALAFANDSVLRLDQLTTLRLHGMEEKRRSVLELLFGAVQFFSHRPRTLEVDTPFVNAAAEGTEFLVQVAEDAARVVMYEGRVRLANPQGELLLAAGDAALVPQGAAPQPLVVVRPRDAVAWTIYYPPILTALAERTPRAEELPAGLRRAVEQVAADDYPDALEALDAVPPAQRDAQYWTYRAGVLLNVGRVERAEDAIREALHLVPEDAGALAQQAVVLVARQEENEALRVARRAVDLAPNSAPARIALSYAHQARAELDAAREVLREAVEVAPGDALAWARLAEIELSFGALDAALEAAARATALAPDLARTQTVLGFAELTRIDVDDAKAAFERAITLDSAAPLPRLGLGLARIRESDLDEGRREIEIAAGLDPGDALIRSYLGKAYFEETREGQAGDQFAIAKQLDPNDPTPWFYNAIRLQAENRPIEALQDLQTSIRLNDNRAVYRSRLLLDQDLATRSVSLARIYDDLGFDQLAITEASRSLSLDPANWSAHRFVSDAAARLPRNEITRASELLQAQLLQPININPLQPSISVADLDIVEGLGPAQAAFSEFHSLFERNRVQLTATGVVGDAQGNDETFGDEIVAAALWNRLSLSLGQFHFQSEGFRPNNEVDTDIYNAFVQVAATPELSLQGEYRWRDTDKGDLALSFDPDDFDEALSQEIKQETARVGLRYSPTVRSDMLASLIYSRREEDQILNFPPVVSDGMVFPALAISGPSDEEGYQAEAQHLLRTRIGNIVTGAGFNDIDVRNQDLVDDVIISDVEFASNQHNVYMYANTFFPEEVIWTAGLSYDDFEEGRFDRREVSPKFGVQWNITDFVRLRLAAFKSVKRRLLVDQTIEPTQIAGFNQFFDFPNGTQMWRYGAGLDVRLLEHVHGGLEFAYADLSVPRIDVVEQTSRLEDQEETLYIAYLYWTPHPWWSFDAEVLFDDFAREASGDPLLPTDVETLSAPAFVRFFHPGGVFALLGATYVHQEVDRPAGSPRAEGDEDFIVVDAALGYRLPRRLGVVSLEVRNLLDEGYRFQDDNFRTPETADPRFIPDRTVLLRATMTF